VPEFVAASDGFVADQHSTRGHWAGPEFPWTGCWEKLMKENSHVYIEETGFRSCGRSRKGD
jgi:hypothetical protein